ncbi:hypothetical protein JIV24_21920 [Carboxylicivirga sp. N1Y132]|uniref:beta-galactosidase n=2 Tax=Carboxylicivirga marina TaxID=2800988 RepID=A0ABS1HR69_9BACT|nr:hypothetical protein [Carboxylicivirga marina]
MCSNAVEANEKKDWENPKMFNQNKEAPHASLMPFSSVENALTQKHEASVFYKSLNGTWKFNWVRKPADRSLDFYNPNYDVSGWDDIPVPSNWEREGYGIPIYCNHQYEFASYKAPVSEEIKFVDKMYPSNPGQVPYDYKPGGSCRRTFTVPESWDGRQVFIQFGAVKSAFYIWGNGQKVGYSQGSKTEAEWDITKYLQKGENTIAVEVYGWSDDSYLECQDFWRISGIERDVFIYSAPKVRIRDFFVNGDLDETYTNGPHGNYVDRNRSAFVGYYESKVAGQYVPYVRPQESGYKTGSRWFELRNNDGWGLRITGVSQLGFSALHNPIEDFDQETHDEYKHLNDIVKKDGVFITFDLKQMGVAGDNSWGGKTVSYEQYAIPADDYEFKVSLEPVF